MKIYIYFLIAIFFAVALVKSGSGITCTLRSGSCAASEACLFSLYQENDSHAAVCGEYTFNVCCDSITSHSIKSTSCDVGESGLLAFYNTTNSHVERYGLGNYNNYLCVSPPVLCVYNTTCASDETCLISMNSTTNSHVGSCNYYSNKLCCKSAYITINLNATKVWWGDGINASGSTFPNTWVQINRSSSNICNITSDSNGFYSCAFTAPSEVGVYTYNAYALNNNGTVITQNSALLNVALTYGGIATRGDVSVYELPMLIQEPTGKIRTVTVKIKVWRVV